MCNLKAEASALKVMTSFSDQTNVTIIICPLSYQSFYSLMRLQKFTFFKKKIKSIIDMQNYILFRYNA